MGQGWNSREDRLQAGGCHITMGSNDAGTFVRYMLLVTRAPIWRERTAPIAMIVRCYADGTTTLCEETWEG